MKSEIEELIKYYEEIIEEITQLRTGMKYKSRRDKLSAKRSTFRGVIYDLKRVLKNSENELGDSNA